MNEFNVPEPHPPRNIPEKPPRRPAALCTCDVARVRRAIHRMSRQLDALRLDLGELRSLIHEASGVYLNAKFPYGRPTDRWSRRSRYS